jgi:hypothetical protein
MPCETDSFEDDLADLSSAEEFLEYFDIDFDVRVVQVNRLHILQRFHDYLAKQEAGKTPDYDAYRQWLAQSLYGLRRLQRADREGFRRVPESRRLVFRAPVLADGLRPCCRAGTTGTRCA